MSIALALLVALGPLATPSQESGPIHPANEAARAALKGAPRRAKVGRVRGVRTSTQLRFLSAPDDAYEMNVAFGFPGRARVILSSSRGASERYQLGETLFARDTLQGGAPEASESVELQGQGRLETLVDIELRRAAFMWPNSPTFTGKGTTFSAQLGDAGILLATVDEASGLPTRIRSFGADGRAGAELHSISYSPAPAPGDEVAATAPGDEVATTARRWPAAFTFAAGGQDIWTETVKLAEYNWLFTDAWFLPSDRLTAVMGSKTEGKLRVKALGGAWVHRASLGGEDLGSKNITKPGASQPRSIRAVADQVAGGWNDFRRTVQASFPGDEAIFVSPYISLVLGDDGHPIAVEYEALAPESTRPKGDGWSWRAPANVWAHSLAKLTPTAGPDALVDGHGILDVTAANASGRKIRLRVGEVTLGGSARTIASELELTAVAVTRADAPPEEGNPREGNPPKSVR